ncbi:MAG TPA: PA14 domain-containing protein [Roseimicrobium sp.]|nr:PA14 domain-containing protein [Roseimicrobium sp.]
MMALYVPIVFGAEAAPATRPAANISGEAFQPGLIVEIYSLQTRPRRIRNLLPGLPAKAVHLASQPAIRSVRDVAGYDGSVQVEFEGEMRFPATGEYKFIASADDGMDLAFDGRPLLANAWINGDNRTSEASAAFREGWHPIRVRFYQGDGGYNLHLRWQPPGASEAVEVPAEHFRVSSSRIDAAKAKLTVDRADESSNPDHAHRAVFRTRGFFELPENDGDLLVEVLEGPTLLSEMARKDFKETLSQTRYAELPYWHQVKVLSGFVRGWYGESTRRGKVSKRAAYVISNPESIEFEGWHGAKRQGFRTIVSIDKQQFTVFTPSAQSPERENVAQGVASLPASLRSMIKVVRVEPYGTANEFNGGGDGIWIRRKEPTSAGMIEDTFSHEIGHLLMNRTDCYLAWETATGKDVLSISHYGRLNPSEDFAEFVRLFLSTEGDEAKLASLRRLFPSRMGVMDTVLKQVNFAWEF